MKTLATYIEYLIMTRRYAFVPGLGGFMVKESAARIERCVDASGVAHISMVPPCQTIDFNRFITHDDGLLMSTLMEFEGISYPDAEARVRQEVAAIKAALEQHETVSLGDWGQLGADAECHWVFTPLTDSHSLCGRARHYGLTTVHMTGWQEPAPAESSAPALRHDEADKDRTHIVLPFNRTIWHRVAMIVLILTCCFCGFFLPTHRQNDSSLAGMIDSEILTGNRRPNVVLHHTWEEVWDNEVSRLEAEEALLASAEASQPAEEAAPEVTAEVQAAEVPAEVTTSAARATALTAEDATADKLFYIIIGSCSDTQEADRQMARFERAGYTDAGVLLKDDRYRICLCAFDDRTAAEAYLEQVRQVEMFHDAWLLPARKATVTYISKIKYNEQLPMELSHLTPGTQRNQGGNHS